MQSIDSASRVRLLRATIKESLSVDTVVLAMDCTADIHELSVAVSYPQLVAVANDIWESLELV